MIMIEHLILENTVWNLEKEKGKTFNRHYFLYTNLT